MNMIDILERLKAQPKVNGAYLKDIEDAIKEIEDLREFKRLINFHLNDDNGDYFLTRESFLEIYGQQKGGVPVLVNVDATGLQPRGKLCSIPQPRPSINARAS